MSKKKNKVGEPLEAGEAKEARFVRIVVPRINKAVKAISLIGNCSGSSYGYTDIQVSDIERVLHGAVENMIGRYKAKSDSSNKFDFMFD